MTFFLDAFLCKSTLHYTTLLGYQRYNLVNTESAVHLSSTERRSSICKLYSGAFVQISLCMLLSLNSTHFLHRSTFYRPRRSLKS